MSDKGSDVRCEECCGRGFRPASYDLMPDGTREHYPRRPCASCAARADLPLERLKLCATGCDVCTVYGEDVEYALSLIASLRVCCDERGAALEAIQRGEKKP